MGNIWMRKLPLALLAMTAISGCTYLPAAGPTASAIEAGAEVATADGGVLARYEIIDVTPAVVEALRGRPLDSLLASFGDHRPSTEPVIGIGDMVSVSVWEAAPAACSPGRSSPTASPPDPNPPSSPSSRSAATARSRCPMPGASRSPDAGPRTSRA